MYIYVYREFYRRSRRYLSSFVALEFADLRGTLGESFLDGIGLRSTLLLKVKVSLFLVVDYTSKFIFAWLLSYV